jgi:hypothetical protein
LAASNGKLALIYAAKAARYGPEKGGMGCNACAAPNTVTRKINLNLAV